MQEPTSSAPAPPERLRSSRQFRVVYERGLKFHTPYFSLFVLPKDGPVVRIGLTVTRKIGGAVVRNRCKRRLREIARRHTLPVLAPPDQDARGCDIIINAKPGLVGAGFAEIGEAYVKALARFRDTRPEALGEGGRRPNETDGDLPVAPL
ncbi:MAG: ribonuclease P protein component [Acidobacteria bacterium]|nr:ribonuclease P protein component [Acidobacteriota bacterium]MCW5968526.1 ribonuclease P protein component [Blastocatellales bacterium]